MMKQHVSAKRLFFVWITLAVLLSWGAQGWAADPSAKIRVAVASNFIAPLKDLATRYEGATGVSVLVSAGSTGKLYAQIKNGAPFDVLLAANDREPSRLVAEGLGVEGTRFTYAQGRLAVWCRSAQTADEAHACLNDPKVRLAIANPRLAPYGKAALETLGALGLDTAFLRRTVTGENIAQTFQLVWSGNVPLGFVAMSQASAHQDMPGTYWSVPPELHGGIKQQAVLLMSARGNDRAKAFLSYLQSDEARSVIENYGYGTTLNLAEAD